MLHGTQTTPRSITYIESIMNARRRLLIALVGVPAILVGLLSMHFLAGANEVSPATMTMSNSTGPSVSAPSTVSPHVDCGVACLTSSNMTMTMACVLGLMVTVIVLAVLCDFRRRDPELLHRLVKLWRARIACLPPPLPPSLFVLSISRI